MTRFNSTHRLVLRTLLLLAIVARPSVSQAPGGPNLATRKELEDTLARLQGVRGTDARVRMIRDRLEHGDFQVGDQVFVRVVGEQHLTDTFVVEPGPVLHLPEIGSVPLAGVLRSELQERVSLHLAQYVREPAVEVRPLIRIMVEGDVARPGYYSLSPVQPLADAITTAGGVTQAADVGDIRVERGNRAIWGGPRLQEALGRGSSLDQLMLQAGDRVIVPSKSGVTPLQVLAVILLIPSAVYTLTHW